jgi:hypothetical protein
MRHTLVLSREVLSMFDHRAAVSALIAAAFLTTPVLAQSAQRWSIQASGLYVGVFGNAYDGLKAGVGGEAQVRLTPSLWSYGFGVQSSRHGLKQVNGTNVSLLGAFFEPRRVFEIASGKYAPYVSARVAYLQQSAEFDAAQGHIAGNASGLSLSVQRLAAFKISASGFQGNIGGGVLTRLSPRVNLDLGATLGLIRFGDATLENNGRSVGKFPGTSGTGQNLLVRAGVAIGLGGGKKPAAAPATKPAARPSRR